MSDGRYKLGRVLISKEEIASRVRDVASEVARDYAGRSPVFICVLRGAVVYLSDLMREIGDKLDLSVEMVRLSSYGSSTESSGQVELFGASDLDIEGRDVLIVEDICDTGRSLDLLTRELSSLRPASIKVCVFLDKPERREIDIKIDYRCFTIPDEFVVGYGLDVADMWRQLPDLWCVES